MKDCCTKGKKVKVKQPYFTSITRDSNSTDKLEVDGALILPPSLHQCSVLRVFKASQSYTERREVETRIWCHQGSNSGPRAPKVAHLPTVPPLLLTITSTSTIYCSFSFSFKLSRIGKLLTNRIQNVERNANKSENCCKKLTTNTLFLSVFNLGTMYF